MYTDRVNLVGKTMNKLIAISKITSANENN